MKYILILCLLLMSCHRDPVAEFPYPDYLGNWRDTVSQVDWRFNQSEMWIGFTKYQFWGIENDTLEMANDIHTVEKKYIVVKKPYLSKQFVWKMELKNVENYYLKKQ